MQKLSLQVKIGALMALAIVLISATGYLSFRSLSAIVSSIRVKSKPDVRLLSIREISGDLEKAENSVRMFTYTRKKADIEPYYNIIENVDDKIERLRTASLKDTLLLNQIDTISRLIEDEIVIWNQMLDLYHSDTIEYYIRKLTAKVAVSTLSNNNRESILRRVFGKRTEKNKVQEEIIHDLHEIEKQNSLQNTRLRAAESQLAMTGREIRERFYVLISRMENEVDTSIRKNVMAADRLALKTYRWLAMFAVLGTLLVILVMMIVIRFVRKTKDYERALIRSKEETEMLARTRELFMANMTHEIRTPVNAIYGFTEQLGYETFDAKSRKILDIIKSSADHLAKIVGDILDITKLQNARIELEKSRYLVGQVFEEIQLLFENKATEKGVRLYHTVDFSVPPLIGDSYRLKQILINLVGNSVKFTDRGEIHFFAGCKPRPDGGLDLILKVHDTGIGISEGMQERVFEDFTQAEPDTSRKYGGTGLGLPIVKKLVELHHGSILLNSQKGSGTRITCILPCYPAGEKAAPARSKALEIPGKIKGLKILVVDDEEYNRLLFRTIFGRWKIRYDEAEDGLKAIELIKANRYDLVFMDIRMPGLDGLESSVFIRNELKIDPGQLPVIGISATHTDEDIAKYQQSGINTFLPKPFTEKMLLDVIVSLTSSSETAGMPPETEKKDRETDVKPRVDLDHLYHLADHDIPFVKQMLTRFIEGTEQGLQEISRALEEGRTENAMETAHKIAAPCKHIGADVLYSNLKAIEKEAQGQKNAKTLTTLSGASQTEFLEIKKILTEHIMKINEP